jgi:hypothetical protein
MRLREQRVKDAEDRMIERQKTEDVNKRITELENK